MKQALTKTIVCFGDSNTWGYNAETGSRFDEKTRWTGLLASDLGSSYRVIEEGLSGRTSVCEDPLFEGLSGISYIHPCLMSHSPLDLVVIMLGTNDTKDRFGLTSFNIAQGIVRLARKAKATEAGIGGQPPEVLVIAPPPIGEKYIDTAVGKPMGTQCSVKSLELADHLAQLLQGTGIHFADSKEHVAMNEVDYMHLDTEGHLIMAKFIRDRVANILKG
ncbi:GDSL-type esterase/lipase family protein [Paenibacillus thalictri]|uniref:Lipolytic enzyme, G-D-S-L n=1 Tax=Paenibacillus thalictri TaxID=2527873 RepID=A0A4Q9DZ04_9BACL|nr:GDSL-type esterase/lipase family protein [Paenibacillus thalictri]TBL80480.1 lipolytic enzyme, G-D-S-L [Paenibacillus thalictri]